MTTKIDFEAASKEMAKIGRPSNGNFTIYADAVKQLHAHFGRKPTANAVAAALKWSHSKVLYYATKAKRA